jgi:hypothetical protein
MPAPTFGHSTKTRAAALTSSPIQVEVQGRVALSQEEAFRYVTDATKIAEWLPMATRSSSIDTKAETPGGVGSVRAIDFGSVPLARELVVALEPMSLYAYSANDRSLRGMYRDHLSVIGFEPHPDGGTVITWLAYARPGNSWVMRYVGLRMFRHVLGNGMHNLEKRFPVAAR